MTRFVKLHPLRLSIRDALEGLGGGGVDPGNWELRVDASATPCSYSYKSVSSGASAIRY